MHGHDGHAAGHGEGGEREGPARHHALYEADRYTSYNDGLFSIVATIAAISLSEVDSDAKYSGGFVTARMDGVIRYVSTFLFVSWFWMQHAAMTRKVSEIRLSVQVYTAFFLLCVSLLPVGLLLLWNSGPTGYMTFFGLVCVSCVMQGALRHALYVAHTPRRSDFWACRCSLTRVLSFVFVIVFGGHTRARLGARTQVPVRRVRGEVGVDAALGRRRGRRVHRRGAGHDRLHRGRVQSHEPNLLAQRDALLLPAADPGVREGGADFRGVHRDIGRG